MAIATVTDYESLRDLRDEVLRRLGDTEATVASARVWTSDEVEGYIGDGIRELGIKGQVTWDMRYLEDRPRVGDHHFTWEEEFYTAGQAMFADYAYHFEWEKDYYTGPPTTGPAYLQYPDERDSFDVSGEIPAAEPLPSDLYSVDRVTWDGRKIEAMNTRQLKSKENLFETVKGFVFGYLQDRDGLGFIRKFRKPSAIGEYYQVVGVWGSIKGASTQNDAALATITAQMTIDGWGVVTATVYAPLCAFGEFSPANSQNGIDNFVAQDAITSVSEFGDDTVVSRGGFGGLKRLPGYFPANGPWGTARRISQDTGNMRVEYWRRAEVPSDASQPIRELDGYMLRYVRHYALYRAYNKRGVGQDLRLAGHYKGRYDAGVARVKARAQSASAAKLRRMGGPGMRSVLPAKPYPRNPRNFPE